jgi:hypothetical protein
VRLVAFLIFLVGVAAFIAAAVLLWKSRQHSGRMSLVGRAVPMGPGDLSNAFPGQVVAISGRAGSEQPLISEQSKTPCIYFDYRIDRRYKTSFIRQRKSGQGQKSESQQTQETVAKDEQWVPFSVEDGASAVRVNPDGAWFDSHQVLDRHEPATKANRDGLPGQKMNLGKGDGLTLDYFITERVIKTGEPVFVVGPVNEQGVIEQNGRHGVIVSHRPDSVLRDEWSNHSRKRLFGCFGMFALGILAFVSGTVATAMSII